MCYLKSIIKKVLNLQKNNNCPVLSFQKYTSRLYTDQSDFWHRPRLVFHQEDGMLYSNSAVEKQILSSFMTGISKSFSWIQNSFQQSYKHNSYGCRWNKWEPYHEATSHKSKLSLKWNSNFVRDEEKRLIVSPIPDDLVDQASCFIPVQSKLNQILFKLSLFVNAYSQYWFKKIFSVAIES